MRKPELEINPEFGSFPQVLEWKPPCCSCVVFTYNGDSRVYFDYHYKCSQHSHLDGQDLIDTLHKDYENTPPDQWKLMKSNSVIAGGGEYAPAILEPVMIYKIKKSFIQKIRGIFHR